MILELWSGSFSYLLLKHRHRPAGILNPLINIPNSICNNSLPIGFLFHSGLKQKGHKNSPLQQCFCIAGDSTGHNNARCHMLCFLQPSAEISGHYPACSLSLQNLLSLLPAGNELHIQLPIHWHKRHLASMKRIHHTFAWPGFYR